MQKITKTPITFQEWYDENEINGIATIDLKYRDIIDIADNIADQMDEDTAAILTKEGILDIPFHTIDWDYKDFSIDVTVEIAFKKVAEGKIKTFVNSVHVT